MFKIADALKFSESFNPESPNNPELHKALEDEFIEVFKRFEWDEEAIEGAMLAALYADHVTAQQQAEITRLNARVAELEKELDGLSNSHATCGKPDCTPTKVCELFFKAGAA